ncbi:MAG: cytochrome c biogenesis protein CcdA [Candidatus Aceula meridiana]|nr:cytochrome c biogenesis protein CcdA [Candidatus Aceula meridiana]
MELSGNFLDYFIVLGAGVMVSFTPCVYPVIPIIAGFIAGANAQGTKRVGFFLSCIYVLGMAITYSALGAIAVLTGQLFGQLQNNPYIFIVVACVLVVFGLIMLNIIPFPVVGAKLQNRIRPKGFIAVFLFGMVSGFVVGPCTAPVLGTLLLYVSSKQNLFHAISLLFVFAYGVGFSLILAGTFSGFLARLPKSGRWLLRVKQASAAILFIAAGYFLFQGILLF